MASSANTSGKKRGRGQPRFEPTQAQRDLVKLLVSDGMPHERICTAIRNPYSGKPIDEKTFVKAFAPEIEIASAEVESIVSASLVNQAKKGNMTAIIWWEKTRRGRREPEYEKANDRKIDPAGADVKHEVEIIGGLPTGSRPDKPEGDDYSDIPPEESHG